MAPTHENRSIQSSSDLSRRAEKTSSHVQDNKLVYWRTNSIGDAIARELTAPARTSRGFPNYKLDPNV